MAMASFIGLSQSQYRGLYTPDMTFVCKLPISIMPLRQFLISTIDFIQVGEAIPLGDASVEAVVGTLVLCSVSDVDLTLKGYFSAKAIISIFLSVSFCASLV